MWIVPLVMLCKYAVSLENETVQSLLTIGAVTNGEQRQECTNETVSLNRHRIIIQWLHTDTSDDFEILKAVRYLDIHSDVDAIVLLDYVARNSTLAQITASMKKPFIYWSTRPPGTIQNINISSRVPLDEIEVCKCEDITTNVTDEPTCLISLNDSSTFKSIKYIYNLHAPYIMMSLIKTLGWKSVIVIYENFTAKDTDILIDLLSASRVALVMYNIDMENLDKRLLEAYRLSQSIGSSLSFMVLCRFGCAHRLLRQLDRTITAEFKVSKGSSCWLIAVYGVCSDVSRRLKGYVDFLQNVAVFSFPSLQGGNDKAPIETFNNDLKKAIVQILDDLENSYVADTSTDLKSHIVSYLTAILEVWNHPVNYTGLNIETLQWIDPKEMDFIPVGYIDLAGNVTLYSDLFPNMKYKFNKRQLVVSTLEYSPFVIKTITPNDTVSYHGMCIDLLEQLSNILNFTYKLVEPPDGAFGAIGPDGKWNGLVGQLERQEVDLVVAPLTVQPDRRGVIDFTYPFFYDHTTVLLKKPDTDRNKWRTLIEPFRWQVLIAICASLPVMSLLVFTMERYNPYYNHPDRKQRREVYGGLHLFPDALWYMYGALLCQGVDRMPDSVTGRTMVSCWALFSLVVVGTYCGNLIAFLTVSIDNPPFNTLKELVAMKDEWKWGIQSGTYYEVIFQVSKTKEYSDIGKGIIDFSKTDTSILSSSLDTHVDKVRAGGYAFIIDKTFTENILAKDCSMMKIKEEFLPLPYAIALPKKSRYTKIVSDEILSIQESGLIQIWKQRWWPKSSTCPKELSTVARPIRVVDVQSAFYLAIIGVVFSTFVFLIEHCIHFYQKRKARNMSNSDDAKVPKQTLQKVV